MPFESKAVNRSKSLNRKGLKSTFASDHPKMIKAQSPHWNPKQNNHPIQRIIEIDSSIYDSEDDLPFLIEELTPFNQGKVLNEEEVALLRKWVTSHGPYHLLGVQLSTGFHKKYESLEELMMAIKGDVSFTENLDSESMLAEKISKNFKVNNHLKKLARKIYTFIEKEKHHLDELKGNKKESGNFWEVAGRSYRGLWRYIGTPYNVNYWLSGIGALSNMHALLFPDQSPATCYKATLADPCGGNDDIFTSIKQASQLYSDRVGKRKFQTPYLRQNEEGRLFPVEGLFEESEQKRYNTQSLREKEKWTLFARENCIPISAGPSGTMDRMYRLASEADASTDELFALALAGHYVFNLVYTKFSSDTHTFHEVMDTLQVYLGGYLPLDYFTRLDFAHAWISEG
ncbi:hypothetical protein [Aureibacter tunicatorum]|uniref:Uncharacterized protein n=1 Tax=Aureibacter tunicatorum TaxID=866807 RepID=A0AAE4BS84_9BACT|nr:hypothetical protein [Aureibacter tunicatorum]MDR6238603.1 hypothetical protein [Aureibacter tunicatorum]BDD05466.1 hypothetical protein AUTU_29490 [Aureibacter tunicatorum]